MGHAPTAAALGFCAMFQQCRECRWCTGRRQFFSSSFSCSYSSFPCSFTTTTSSSSNNGSSSSSSSSSKRGSATGSLSRQGERGSRLSRRRGAYGGSRWDSLSALEGPEGDSEARVSDGDHHAAAGTKTAANLPRRARATPFTATAVPVRWLRHRKSSHVFSVLCFLFLFAFPLQYHQQRPQRRHEQQCESARPRNCSRASAISCERFLQQPRR